MRRMVVAAVTAVMLMTLGIGSAAADPINSPRAETFPVMCDGEVFDVVVTGSGAVAHIVGSTSNFVAQTFNFQLIEDDQVVFEGGENRGQKKGLQGRLMTCILEFPLSPEEIAEVEAEFGLELGDDVTARLLFGVLKTPASR